MYPPWTRRNYRHVSGNKERSTAAPHISPAIEAARVPFFSRNSPLLPISALEPFADSDRTPSHVRDVPQPDVETLGSVSNKRPKSTCFARLPGRSRSQPRFCARNQGLISRMAVQWHQIGLSRNPREVFGRSSANASLQ